MRKFLIIGIIIIIIVGVFLDINFSGYYDSPEAALKNDHDTKYVMKNIVHTVWLDTNPVYFYISETGDFCYAEFSKKNIFGKTGWKSIEYGALPTIKNISPTITLPNKIVVRRQTNKMPNMVLFGVTKSNKASTIKVEGKNPLYKQFSIDGDSFTLWYTTEIDKSLLNNGSIKITSN